MKKLFLFLIIASIALLSVQKSMATHMVGSDLSWTCVGQDSFIVNLTVYRDCNGVQIGAAAVPIKCLTTGASITQVTITKPTPIDITPKCGASCSRCQSYSCSFPYGIEKYVYTKLVVLSSAGSCCKVVMSYSMCCRNSSITTGAANQNFYTAANLDRCLSICDNAPSFSHDPVSIICIGQDATFDFGAYDTDKDSNGKLLDSLSYEWVHPLSSASSNISYVGQYAYNKPIYFWGFPSSNLPFPRGFHLNGATGEVSFRPMKIEQTVMAVAVKEWRKNSSGNMEMICSVRRDIQIIVISCQNNNAPILSGPYYKTVAAGSSVIFQFSTLDYDTKDTLTLWWSENIDNAAWLTSNGQEKQPTAYLVIPTDASDIGNTYRFSVSVKDDACPVQGKSSKAYQYTVTPPDSNANPVEILYQLDTCGFYTFSASDSGAQNTWHIVDGVPIISKGKSVTHRFASPGSYSVILERFENNVSSIISSLVVTSSSPYLTLELQDTFQVQPGFPPTVNPVIKNPNQLNSFKWHDGNTTVLNRTFPYLATIPKQKIKLSLSDSVGCIVQDSSILFHGYASVQVGEDIIKCKLGNTLVTADVTIFDVANKTSNYGWYKEGSTVKISSSYSLNPQDSGNFVYILSLQNGYTTSDTVHVAFWPKPSIYVGQDTVVCSNSGAIPLFAHETYKLSYWSGFGIDYDSNGTFIDILNNSFINNQPYSYNYSYSDSKNCRYTFTKTLTVKPKVAKPKIGPFGPYCIHSKVYDLFGSTIGTFSGPGIINQRYFNADTAGIGTHEIIFKAGYDLCPEYDTTYITVNDIPHPALATKSGITEFCADYGKIELTGTPLGGWFYGYKVIGNTVNTKDQNGDFNVHYGYTDSNGCSNNGSLTIKLINKPMAIDLQTVNGQSEFCPDYGIIEFIGTPSGGLYLGNNVVGNTVNTKDEHENFDVYYKYTDTTGCSNIDTLTIQLQNKAIPIDLKTVNGQSVFCQNYGEIELLGIPSGGSYFGNNINGNKINTNDQSVNFDVSYYYTDSNGCSNRDTLNLSLIDTADFNFSAKQIVKQSNQWKVFFSMKANANPQSFKYYYWKFGDGETSQATNPSHTYKAPGNYSVSLRIINEDGCMGTVSKEDYISVVVGVEEEGFQEAISIVPNPATYESLIISQNLLKEIWLYNALGDEILHAKPMTKTHKILSPGSGLFFIRIVDIDNNIYFKKVIFND